MNQRRCGGRDNHGEIYGSDNRDSRVGSRCVDSEHRSFFSTRGSYGGNRCNIFNRHEHYNFQFCDFADRRGDYESRFCASDNMSNRGHHKSGVPDGEQDKVFGAPVRKGPIFKDETFEGLGAKHFEGLAAQDPEMEMFNFPCSVGVNNLECKTWEEEQDVLPGSRGSACFLYNPTVRRRGGVGIHVCYDEHATGPNPSGNCFTAGACGTHGSNIVPLNYCHS